MSDGPFLEDRGPGAGRGRSFHLTALVPATPMTFAGVTQRMLWQQIRPWSALALPKGSGACAKLGPVAVPPSTELMSQRKRI